MAQKKETSGKKDVNVRDLAPKKDAKGGALRRPLSSAQGGSAAQGRSALGSAAQGGNAAQGNAAN